MATTTRMEHMQTGRATRTTPGPSGRQRDDASARSCPDRSMRRGLRPWAHGIRSRSFVRKPRHEFQSWCPSAMAGWPSRRSPSSGAAPRSWPWTCRRRRSTGLTVQACGDAHVSNFGKFATPERNIVFDINDFDETLPGPWEWDVKRLCASLHIVARERGFSPARVPTRWCATAARAYRERMAELRDACARSSSGTTGSTIDDVIAHFPPRYRARLRRDIKRARRKDHRPRRGRKLTRDVDGRLRFVEDPPLIVHLERHRATTWTTSTAMIESYRASLTDDRRDLFDRFHVVDVARKVVGVGSVGTRCWIVLLEGPTTGAAIASCSR